MHMAGIAMLILASKYTSDADASGALALDPVNFSNKGL